MMNHRSWNASTLAATAQQQFVSSAPMAHYQHNTGVAPPATDGPTVSADEVGAAFALQYFKIMKTRPSDLFCFYNSDSRVSRGSLGLNGSVDVRHAVGPVRIRELLHKEHTCGMRLALAVINNLEAQDSACGAVIVQITGTLKFVDDSAREFVMTAFLVHQDSGSAFDYYVLNDILVFPQPPQPPQENTSSLGGSNRQISNDKPLPARMSKPSFSLPQQTRLTQQSIDPVNPPVAPSAQPAAAPLPITTAPQLSGASNTPMAVSIEAFGVYGSPAFTVKDAVDGSPSVETKSIDPLVEEAAASEQQKLMTHERPEQAAGVVAGVVVESDSVKERQLVINKDETKEGDTLQAKNVKEHQVASTQTSPTDLDKARKSLVGETASGPKEKKSAWNVPVSSTTSPEGFGDIAEATSPIDKLKQPQASGALADRNKSESTSKPVDPSKYHLQVDPTKYSESSYAAKLLRPGPHGLHAPCQTGFAVPPEHDRTGQDQRNRRQFQSYRNRPGRGKTLWVSPFPSELSDAQIGKAVADQLRGQSCEGHVIRIERIPGQTHGFIELDTEICAKELIGKGLHLNGRAVTVDFPGKNLRRRSFQQHENNEEFRRHPYQQQHQQEPQQQQPHQQQQHQGQHPQQQRRPFNTNFQRYQSNQANGYQQQNTNSNSGNTNNGVAASSLNSQENEEGWTPASRQRRPQQARRQQRFQPNTTNNNSNGNPNRWQNGDYIAINKSFSGNSSNSNTNNGTTNTRNSNNTNRNGNSNRQQQPQHPQHQRQQQHPQQQRQQQPTPAAAAVATVSAV